MTIAESPNLTVRRKPDRQSTDATVLREILEEGFVAHVALVRDGLPIVLPYLYGVGDLGEGPVLLLHGSTGGGLFLDAGPEGVPVSASITHVDGLVFARSTFDSSANYRSAMVFGRATVVPDHLQELALWQVADHLMPGRRAEVREMTRKETRATRVLQVPLDRTSVKVRFAGVGDTADDGDDHAVWAGVLPLSVRAGAPLASTLNSDAAPAPAVAALAARLEARATDREVRLAHALRG